MFYNSDYCMLGYEIEQNEDGITTITQEDIEAEAETSEASKMDISLVSFENLKVDGREAAIIFCNIGYGSMSLPTHYAEIINGDQLIEFTLIAYKEDAEILKHFLRP